MRLCVLLRSARSIIIGNNTLTITTFLFSTPNTTCISGKRARYTYT